MIPVFERAKTFHALDRAASVIGTIYNTLNLLWILPEITSAQSNVVFSHKIEIFLFYALNAM
jgi:hypothetical protein